MTDNLYDILDVPKDADSDTIKKAYRRRARKTHPDHGGNAKDFQTVALAYRVLSDQEARKKYDRTGRVDDKGHNPDSGEAQFEAAAINVMVNRVLSIMECMKQHQLPEHTNIVQEALRSFSVDISEKEKSIRRTEDAVKREQKWLKRLSTKKKTVPNLVEIAILENIRMTNAHIDDEKKAVSLLKRASELLADYEDHPPQNITDPGYSRITGGTIFTWP